MAPGIDLVGVDLVGVGATKHRYYRIQTSLEDLAEHKRYREDLAGVDLAGIDFEGIDLVGVDVAPSVDLVA